ncbi:MAG: L-aspartate oxidase, partial [Pseudonocardiales bacterium]|nr:L-aspartate oxidase [Pseudonocardiales bacterium]
MTELAPGLSREAVAAVVARALAEDLGEAGDVTTTSTVDASTLSAANVVARQDGVVAGLPVAAYVFETVGQGRVQVEFGSADGARVVPGEVLATVRGPMRDLLTAERTALNLIGH